VADLRELPELRRQLRLEGLADPSPPGAEFQQDRTLHLVHLFPRRLPAEMISVRPHDVLPPPNRW
jgi:hypothetical protein